MILSIVLLLLVLVAVLSWHKYAHYVQEPSFDLVFEYNSKGKPTGVVRSRPKNGAALGWLEDYKHSDTQPADTINVFRRKAIMTFNGRQDVTEEIHGFVNCLGSAMVYRSWQPIVPVFRQLTATITTGGVVRASATFDLDTNLGPGPIATWHPQVRRIPANAIKFYLCFSEPMTSGGIFEHLRLEDANYMGPPHAMNGAFREVELWSPDMRRLTVWLHPGRQKSGVNLNEEEGAVLVPGKSYHLVLSREATTQRGAMLEEDQLLAFSASDPVKKRLTAETCLVRTLPSFDSSGCVERVYFGSSETVFDPAMLQDAVMIDGKPALLESWPVLNGDAMSSYASFKPSKPLAPGQHTMEVNPELEDICGNNFLRAFETETGDALPPPAERKPVSITFEVK